MNNHSDFVKDSINNLKNSKESNEYLLNLNKILERIEEFDIGKIVWILHNINLNCIFLGKEYQKFYSQFEEILKRKREEKRGGKKENQSEVLSSPKINIQAEYEEMRNYELKRLGDRLKTQEELVQTQTNIISNLIYNRELIREKDNKIKELIDENELNLRNFEERYLNLQGKYENKIKEYQESVKRMEEDLEITYSKIDELNEVIDEKNEVIARLKDLLHSNKKELELYQDKITKIKRCLKDFD